MAKILLHICCAPCATYPVPLLRAQGFEVRGYFYNPNIHPYSEYVKRQEALQQYAEKEKLEIIYDRQYNPINYFQSVSYRENRRCLICYRLRLEQAARIARKGKFDFFTTTLLVSKFQKHDLIREIGEAAGENAGVPFLYRDFREGFKETGRISREMGIYRQQYCGCVFSEMERYAPKDLLKQVFSSGSSTYE